MLTLGFIVFTLAYLHALYLGLEKSPWYLFWSFICLNAASVCASLAFAR